ncbi:hypothetical protein Tco_0314727, partial [Tanacetum coccineum]
AKGSNNTTIHVQPSFKIQPGFSFKETQPWMPIEEERLETVTTPNRWLTKEKKRCRIEEERILESVTTLIQWLTKKKTNLSREEHYQVAIRTSFCSKIATNL